MTSHTHTRMSSPAPFSPVSRKKIISADPEDHFHTGSIPALHPCCNCAVCPAASLCFVDEGLSAGHSALLQANSSYPPRHNALQCIGQSSPDILWRLSVLILANICNDHLWDISATFVCICACVRLFSVTKKGLKRNLQL